MRRMNERGHLAEDHPEVVEHELEECYTSLPEETIRVLEQRLLRIKASVTRSALEIGYELAEARKDIQRYQGGGFQAWVKTKVGITEQYAYQLIAVYEQFGESKPGLLSHFVDKALRLLAAPSVPQEAREEALQLAEAGESITVRQARELVQAHQARQRAEEAEQQARQEAEWARQQLREKEMDAQEEIAYLTQHIATLTQEMASLSTPEVEIRAVEREVISPEVTAQLEHLQKRVQELTEQRDNLSKKAQQLGADLAALREDTEAQREREMQAARIRQRWHQATATFRQHLLHLFGQLPSSLDTRVFETDDWDRLAQLENLAQRLLSECRTLRDAPQHMMVDAE